MGTPEIVVMRQKIHGLSAETYAAALQEELPEREIAIAETPTEEQALLKDARIVTGFTISESQLEQAENLELFACIYAGTGHLPMELLNEHDVAVTNASGVHGPNIAEYVIGSLIMQARDFPRAMRQQNEHVWRSFETRELQDSTVVIAGLGAIGTAICERLEPFGVKTVGVRYSPEKGGPTDEVYGFDEIHTAVRDAEYLVLACPLTDATEGLIDADVFLTMPSNTVLVNIARGPVVDADALVSALRSNRIAGAVLDVTDPEPLPPGHPLWDFNNVQITPHNAGHTPYYYDRLSEILKTNVEALEDGTELQNRVN
ncbi:D-2-hydroxyacid dehydrogenase [Natronocalculus amylovorans]|uniref:D-2-hydroxyacid dehydrogenase n=1 Tax=Natronocalculus amylovorans TaxID=2917812 RepID=A0AAE3K9M0_9EURY|nr:D-2-hydroxyacid dehydrogenase [Natronocalculus amylovorans]MCL9816209.1 D-2-hydroxyacid dehydrogenase [Natronocalculus amylovorans]